MRSGCGEPREKSSGEGSAEDGQISNREQNQYENGDGHTLGTQNGWDAAVIARVM